jgi:hypothetical protein
MTNADHGASMREHAWRYFELHANQRIAVFNFFLLASGAIAAGLATTLQGTPRFSSLGIALGALLMLVAFIFWKLDQRASFLIKHAENALAETERAFPANEACLFLFEPKASKQASQTASWWSKQWTYGQAFRFVFIVMGLFGVAGAALSLARFTGWLTW